MFTRLLCIEIEFATCLLHESVLEVAKRDEYVAGQST
jgi:hypothetical protein